MKTPPSELLTAAATMLRPYWPDLTETRLVRGILAELKSPEQSPAQAGELLTIRQFCNLVKCSRVTCWRLVNEKRIRQIRLGRNSVRIPASELVRLAAGGNAQ